MQVTLIQNQGIGDLYRIYATTERDGIDFKLAYIPASFDVPLPEPFDSNYMQKHFELGYKLTQNGFPWEKRGRRGSDAGKRKLSRC